MKVLWIMNSPIGIAAERLTGTHSQSGTWIDATLRTFTDEDYSFAIAAYNTQRKKVYVNDRLVIYGVGETSKIGRNTEGLYISDVIDEFKPNIIQIWGTEFPFGLNVLKIAKAKSIPVLFYIQGVMAAISEYAYGDLGLGRLLCRSGPAGALKIAKLFIEHRDYKKQALIERKMLESSSGYICDNEWVSAHFFKYNNNCYHHTTPINEAFLSRKWEYKNSKAKTIMTIGGTNAGKGQHKLLEALCTVKEYYPDVKVIIPGNMRFGWKENPYVSYLKWFISKNGLNDNVEFCGQLNSEQMAQKLFDSDVFVNPSYIENISTSLREAMYMGLPCITSQVGSLHEVIHNGYNGFSYRFEETQVLAYEILEIFNNRERTERLAENAYISIREKYPQEDTCESLKLIYSKVVNGQ